MDFTRCLSSPPRHVVLSSSVSFSGISSHFLLCAAHVSIGPWFPRCPRAALSSSHVISGKRKKTDLIKLAIELGECESNGEELKIIKLRTKILTNDSYKEDPEFVKSIFEGIVSNRIDEENKQKEQTLREFELQKIRLQNETQRVVGPQTLPQIKIELKKLLPTFNPEVDNMDLFLTLFERANETIRSW
ncbi:uncharacterized protein TNCV_5104021 [Trichonephila clavipes]|nr:uncharacterized protein TNCV_5104021 [Trichonephila clavipes]